MSNFKNQVKSFSGVVHINDIQEEFDRLLQGLKELQKRINEVSSIGDIDLSVGKDILSPADCTLTLGALKKVLQVYQNKAIIRPKIIKLPSGKYKAFPGLFCINQNESGCIQTKDNVINSIPQYKEVDMYIDSATNEITTTETDNIKIDTINGEKTSDELKVNPILNNYFTNSKISSYPDGNYLLNMKTKTFGPKNSSNYSGQKFLLPKVGERSVEGTFKIAPYASPMQAVYHSGRGEQQHRAVWFYNPIWLPKTKLALSLSFTGAYYPVYIGYTINKEES